MSQQMEDDVAWCMDMIRSGAPSACELSDCYDLRTAVRRLLEFANRAVNPPRIARDYGTPCGCWMCRRPEDPEQRMILCPMCGNKRCPHATDHRHLCSGSNEPGQPGSRFQASERC